VPWYTAEYDDTAAIEEVLRVYAGGAAVADIMG
jgi:hypothetical protein